MRMIPISESWESITHRAGVKHLRRGRGECPFCESRTGFSVNDEKGFHCFACGVHGDKISFVQKLHKCDFTDALRFFGLEPGIPPKPDPAIERKRKARDGLKAWAEKIGKELRFEFYVREKVITRALQRLRRNADDSYAWNWLCWALIGHSALEYRLDTIDIGTEEQRLDAYRQWRNAA